MPLEINKDRTPPAMKLKKTQSCSISVGQIERNASPLNSVLPNVVGGDQFKDVSSLKVNQRRSRSFTPVKDAFYLRSPELSPIDGSINRQHVAVIDYQSNSCETPVLERSFSPCEHKVHNQSSTPMEFKIPKAIKSYEGTTPNRYGCQENYCGSIEFEDPNQTQSLDKSASHGFLNHNLDVGLILKNAGLQKYTAAFEMVNFENFLSLSDKDLLQFGIKRKLDRKVILTIINDLNSN